MSTEDVYKLAQGFAGYWNERFQDSPRYQLDFSWPSLGVVDGILLSVRGKTELNGWERAQIHGAATYLGFLAYACWTQFADAPKVELLFTKEEDVLIRASGGKNLREKESFEVNVSAALKQILASPEDPFPFFEKYSRVLPPNANLVSLFALGLVSGACPYGTGPWKDLDVRQLEPYLGAANIGLAESCVAYYQRVFPSEPFGARAELYRSCLIFPPLGFKESGFATRAVHGFVTCMKHYGATRAEMRVLAQNLATMPDEVISSAGYAVCVALSEGEPTAVLRLQSEQLGHSKLLLRPAILFARQLLDEMELPAALLEKEEYAKAEPLLRLEQKLGLLPLVKLDISRLMRKELFGVLNFLFWPQAPAARDALIAFLKEHPETALTLQLAYLHIFLGEGESARKLIQDIPFESLDSAELRALDAELRGYLFLGEKNPAQAARCFAEALAENGLSADTRELLVNMQAETLVSIGERDKAKELLDSYTEKEKSSLRTMTNRVPFIEDEQEFQALVDYLRRVTPHEPRLFQYYLRQKLQ